MVPNLLVWSILSHIDGILGQFRWSKQDTMMLEEKDKEREKKSEKERDQERKGEGEKGREMAIGRQGADDHVKEANKGKTERGRERRKEKKGERIDSRDQLRATQLIEEGALPLELLFNFEALMLKLEI